MRCVRSARGARDVFAASNARVTALQVVAKNGLLYTEVPSLSYILCRPRIMELGAGAWSSGGNEQHADAEGDDADDG